MSSSISQLSASVTRILSLTGFPKELKTRDIQSAFSEFENASGGFKIKWIDDTSLLIVFADAIVGTFVSSSSIVLIQQATCLRASHKHAFLYPIPRLADESDV